MFKREYKERVATAAVLAALSAVPISVGLAARDGVAHLLWLGLGLALWVCALALLYPGRS